MKPGAHALAVLATALLLPCGSLALRGGNDVASSATPALTEDRSAEMERRASVLPHHGGRNLQVVGNFERLVCNDNMPTTCEKWTTSLASFTDETGVVTIPCGSCVDVDVTTASVESLKGLNVIGHLNFPETSIVTIETPFLYVQGKLSMSLSTTPVGPEPLVKFTMTENDAGGTNLFVPYGANSAVCPEGGCDVGKKAVVVAGGELDINALDDSCPTWSFFEDYASSGVPEPTVPVPQPPSVPEGCSEVVIGANFELSDEGWYGNLGAEEEVVDSGGINDSRYLKISKRTDRAQGPLLDLSGTHRACLQAGVEYFFSAKIKLDPSPDNPNHVSLCSRTGELCPILRFSYMTNDDKIKWRDLAMMTSSQLSAAKPVDGQWFDLTGSVVMEEEWVHSDNIFEAITINNVGPKMDISLDNLRFGLPPPAAYAPADNACQELLLNGGADLIPGFTTPYYSFLKQSGVSKLFLSDDGDGNPYFSIRDRTQTFDSLAVPLPVGCLVTGHTYTFSAKIRLKSSQTARPNVLLKTFTVGTPTFDVVTQCPDVSESSGWTTCTGDITWKDHHTANRTSEMVELLISFAGDLNSDADFDDLRFTWKQGVPSGGVQLGTDVTDQCYTPGVQAVIPSDDLLYDRYQEVTLSEVTPSGSVGFVNPGSVRLPTTRAEDERFPGQIAFLGRNVEFDGEGGTLTVMSSPAVSQKIQGVRFTGFGQPGQKNRHPITFSMMGDATNSMVTKNAITNSQNRCVQIQGTNNLRIAENVAFDTIGHCYALQDGSETGNVFEKNFGAVTRKATVEIPRETDHAEVATYYISNPTNSWIGNVAAGSEAMGFQFRLQQGVVGASRTPDNLGLYPYRESLIAFDSNIIHSSFFMGVKTYPMGYNPRDPVTFTNTVAYRNRGHGFWILASSNLILDGGHFADNRNSIVVQKSDKIVIKNINVVGQTPLYKSLSETDGNAPKLCTGTSTGPSVVGINLHPNKIADLPGVQVENATFSGFTQESGCDPSRDDTAAISFLHTDMSMEKTFTTSVSFTNLTFSDGSLPANEVKLCKITEAGVSDIAMVDTDGSLNPLNSGDGTIISAGAVCDGDRVAMAGSCAEYCVGGTAGGGGQASDASAPVADSGIVPADVASSVCLDNGSFEAGTIGWNGGPNLRFMPKVTLTTGVNGAGAAAGQAIAITERTHQARGGIEQDITPSQCLVPGQWYEVSADVRVLQGSTQEEPFECDPAIMWYNTGSSCPALSIFVAPPNDRIEIAPMVGPYQTGDDAWNKLHGIFEASADIIAQSRVKIFVAGAPVGVDIYIDNVALNPVSEPFDCASPLINGNFELNNYDGWFIRGRGEGGDLEMTSPGYNGVGHALRHMNRSVQSWHGILQRLPMSCFTEGSTWEISAKFRMYQNDGTPVACTRNANCPTFEFGAAGIVLSGPLKDLSGQEAVAGEWSTIRNKYTIVSEMVGLTDSGHRDMWLTINRVPGGHYYDIDNIVLAQVG